MKKKNTSFVPHGAKMVHTGYSGFNLSRDLKHERQAQPPQQYDANKWGNRSNGPPQPPPPQPQPPPPQPPQPSTSQPNTQKKSDYTWTPSSKANTNRQNKPSNYSWEPSASNNKKNDTTWTSSSTTNNIHSGTGAKPSSSEKYQAPPSGNVWGQQQTQNMKGSIPPKNEGNAGRNQQHPWQNPVPHIPPVPAVQPFQNFYNALPFMGVGPYMWNNPGILPPPPVIDDTNDDKCSICSDDCSCCDSESEYEGSDIKPLMQVEAGNRVGGRRRVDSKNLPGGENFKSYWNTLYLHCMTMNWDQPAYSIVPDEEDTEKFRGVVICGHEKIYSEQAYKSKRAAKIRVSYDALKAFGYMNNINFIYASARPTRKMRKEQRRKVRAQVLEQSGRIDVPKAALKKMVRRERKNSERDAGSSGANSYPAVRSLMDINFNNPGGNDGLYAPAPAPPPAPVPKVIRDPIPILEQIENIVFPSGKPKKGKGKTQDVGKVPAGTEDALPEIIQTIHTNLQSYKLALLQFCAKKYNGAAPVFAYKKTRTGKFFATITINKKVFTSHNVITEKFAPAYAIHQVIKLLGEENGDENLIEAIPDQEPEPEPEPEPRPVHKEAEEQASAANSTNLVPTSLDEKLKAMASRQPSHPGNPPLPPGGPRMGNPGLMNPSMHPDFPFNEGRGILETPPIPPSLMGSRGLRNPMMRPNGPRMGNQGNPRPRMENQGNPRPWMGDQRNPRPWMEDQGNPRPWMGNHGNPRPWMGDHGNPRPRMGDHGNPRPRMGNHGNFRPRMGNQGNPRPWRPPFDAEMENPVNRIVDYRTQQAKAVSDAVQKFISEENARKAAEANKRKHDGDDDSRKKGKH